MELNTIDKRWIRQHVAVVPQEPFLFAKTIRENVTLASGDVPDEELYAICKEAAIHDVIKALIRVMKPLWVNVESRFLADSVRESPSPERSSPTVQS